MQSFLGQMITKALVKYCRKLKFQEIKESEFVDIQMSPYQNVTAYLM